MQENTKAPKYKCNKIQNGKKTKTNKTNVKGQNTKVSKYKYENIKMRRNRN